MLDLVDVEVAIMSTIIVNKEELEVHAAPWPQFIDLEPGHIPF